MSVYEQDRLPRRHSVSQSAQVASASSATAAILRALVRDPEVRVGPGLRSEASLVFSWLDDLAECSEKRRLMDLLDEDQVTSDPFVPASLIARVVRGWVAEPSRPPTHSSRVTAAPEREVSDEERERRMRLALEPMLVHKEVVTQEGDALRVVDHARASKLAKEFDMVSNALVEDAYELDRDRSGQFAVA